MTNKELAKKVANLLPCPDQFKDFHERMDKWQWKVEAE